MVISSLFTNGEFPLFPALSLQLILLRRMLHTNENYCRHCSSVPIKSITLGQRGGGVKLHVHFILYINLHSLTVRKCKQWTWTIYCYIYMYVQTDFKCVKLYFERFCNRF